MRTIEIQYDLFCKVNYRGPKVGICSIPFNLAAEKKRDSIKNRNVCQSKPYKLLTKSKETFLIV